MSPSRPQQSSQPHERLDRILVVPRPAQWAVLAAVLAFLAGALIWGVYGAIPTTVPGAGILIRNEAVFDVVPLGGGQVRELLVDIDDEVTEGQLIGRINRQDLAVEIAKAESLLSSLKAEQDMVDKFGQQALDKKSTHLAKRRASVEAALLFSEAWLKDIRNRTEAYRDMADKGIVSQNEYLNSKHEYDQTVERIMDYRALLAGLSAENVDIVSLKEKEGVQIAMEVVEAEKRLESMRALMASSTGIISPRKGRVVEIFKGARGIPPTRQPGAPPGNFGHARRPGRDRILLSL